MPTTAPWGEGSGGAGGTWRRLVLASASPRRQEILSAAGIEFDVDTSDVEPELDGGQAVDPVDFARGAAVAKALDVAVRHEGRLVVGADTVVAVGGTVLGKPIDEADATEMLRLLSGRENRVTTAFAVAAMRGGQAELLAVDHETSGVVFKAITPLQIAEYVRTGEPLDKAGAYAVQGLGAELIERVEGDYLNVVGLPLEKLCRTLSELGWPAGPALGQ
ncbi:MAG TPA: septum formation protein Maf [Armatimonadetes bacterium]|nr:septum formation protein Maf [Armatimonadota bacterium]